MPNTKHRRRFLVDLQPTGRRAQIEAGQSLLAAAQEAGAELVAICGGAGSCGSCRVRLIRGEVSPPTRVEEEILTPEEFAAGLRLACQAIPLSDVKLDIPPESLTTPQRLQLEGQEIAVELDPIVLPRDVQIDPPSLHDLRADASRLLAVLSDPQWPPPEIGLPVLAGLSDRLRAQDWSARLALRQSKHGAELVAVLPMEHALLGLAVDVGTTKLAAYLVDLSTGETLSKEGAMNPQVAYGEDVVSRIAYANQGEGNRRLLQVRLVQVLNDLVTDVCTQAGASREQIVEAVVVGNTVMQHLFAGLPVRQLGMAPYVAAVSDPLDIRAHELGLELAPGARVYLPPNIAGYVGADHVAMVLSTDLWRTERTTIALDIGTNTEISLATNGRLLCCSCASGPAFEGAHIRDGMRAAPGAIERVRIVGGKVRTHTIGGQPPVGICGSGILDAVAEMLATNVLDRRGTFNQDHPDVRAESGPAEFVLVPAAATGHNRDIVVTRKDVNEIQLAKGAIRSGIEILLEQAGIKCEDVEEFIIAGAFGTYLDVGSAVRVGMFPNLPLGRFCQVGNAAGSGARQMLLSRARRKTAAEIRQRIEYIELTTHPGFTQTFAKSMLF